MSNVIAFFAGMTLMSALAIAAMHFDSAGQDIPCFLCMGPVAWVFFLIGTPVTKIYKAVTLHYFKHNFIRCRFYLKEGYSEDTWYIHKDVVELFYHQGENHDERCITEETDCMNARSIPYHFERCINKNGWMFKPNASDHWMREAALSCIRPYTDLYWKIEHGG